MSKADKILNQTDEKGMIYTGKSKNHMHTIDPNMPAGMSGVTDNHSHYYEGGMDKTGPGGKDGHTHPVTSSKQHNKGKK